MKRVSVARSSLIASAVLAASVSAAPVLAGCGDGNEREDPSPSPSLTSRGESDVRRAVATLGSNVAHGLGKIQQFPPEDLSVEPCPGADSRDVYTVHGRFDIGATPEAWEGGLTQMREQWVQLRVTRIETSGTGSATTRLAGNTPGKDSYRIAVVKSGPPRGFHIEVTSPCYLRP